MNRNSLAIAASVLFVLGRASFADDLLLPIEQPQVQRIRLDDEQILLNDIDIQIESLPIRTNAEQLRMEFDRRIEELDEICQLTPVQLKKLKVASKGAIAKSSEKQNSGNSEIRNRLNVGFLLEINGLQGRTDPFQQPIWKNTVQKILSEDQRKLLEEHERQQREKRATGR